MEVKITETGKLKTLEIIDPKTGLDWAADMTGDDDNFGFDGDNRTCDQETFDWWLDVMDRYQQADNRLHDLTQEFSDLEEWLFDNIEAGDIENYPETLQDALDEWENEHN